MEDHSRRSRRRGARRFRIRRQAPPRGPPRRPCARPTRGRRAARRRRSPRAAPSRARRSAARARARSSSRRPCGRRGRRAGRGAGSRRRRSRRGSPRPRASMPEVSPLCQYSSPRAAPEPRLAALARPAQGLLVHPREHQHAAGLGVLHDRGRQLRIGHPRSFSAIFSAGSSSGRSWTIEATRAASAPASNASERWPAFPAPPEAITGTVTASATAAVSGEVVALARTVGVDRGERGSRRRRSAPPSPPIRPRSRRAPCGRRG